MLFIPAVQPALPSVDVPSADRPSISDIPFTKHIDKSSPILV
jgi:type VI protein secretion system component Hcp